MRVRFGEMIREGPEKQPVVGSVCCDRSGFVRWIMKAEWVDGFEIRVTAEKGETVISANREGMLSLAKQLRMLADRVPGDHIHYDENNSLEEGSVVMIIERILRFRFVRIAVGKKYRKALLKFTTVMMENQP